MAGASLIEKSSSVLLNAENRTRDEIRGLSPEIEFRAAAGVLNMISRSPAQRQLYEARLKFQRDEAARLEAAFNQGLEEGRAWGCSPRSTGERVLDSCGILVYGGGLLLQNLPVFI